MARNPHPEQTERRILDVARRLFAEKGYERTSVQDIISATGLSKGAVYHHFRSKEAILDRLNDDEWGASLNLRDELRRRHDLNALEKLRALISSTLDAEHLRLVRLQTPLLSDPASFTSNMRFWSDGLPESLRPLIGEGVRDGSIPTAYPAEASQLIALLCNYWLMPCFYPAAREDMARRIRCLASMLGSIGVPLFDEALMARAVDGLMELAPGAGELEAAGPRAGEPRPEGLGAEKPEA